MIKFKRTWLGGGPAGGQPKCQRVCRPSTAYNLLRLCAALQLQGSKSFSTLQFVKFTKLCYTEKEVLTLDLTGLWQICSCAAVVLLADTYLTESADLWPNVGVVYTASRGALDRLLE